MDVTFTFVWQAAVASAILSPFLLLILRPAPRFDGDGDVAVVVGLWSLTTVALWLGTLALAAWVV